MQICIYLFLKDWKLFLDAQLTFPQKVENIFVPLIVYEWIVNNKTNLCQGNRWDCSYKWP